MIPVERSTKLFMFNMVLIALLATPLYATDFSIGYTPSFLYQEESNTATFGGIMNGVEVNAYKTNKDGRAFMGLIGRYSRAQHGFEFKEPVSSNTIDIRTDDILVEGEWLIGIRRGSGKRRTRFYTGYGYGELTNELQSIRYNAPLVGSVQFTDINAERVLDLRYLPVGFRTPFKLSSKGYPATWTLQYNHILESRRQEKLSDIPGILNGTDVRGADGYGVKTVVRFDNKGIHGFRGFDVDAFFKLYAQYYSVDRFADQTIALDLDSDGIQDSSVSRSYPETELAGAGLTAGFTF